MKVLIADKFEKVGVDGLKELGCTVVSSPGHRRRPARRHPGGRSARLIVRGKKVVRAGAGIDTIDVDTAFRASASSSPTVRGRTRSSRAELVMGLLLVCDWRIPDQVDGPTSGHVGRGPILEGAGTRWAASPSGILGLRQIGREIAGRARVVRHAGDRLVAEPHHEEAEPAGRCLRANAARGGAALRRGRDERLRQRDTKHLVGAEFLPRCRSRGLPRSTPRAARW